MTDAEYRGYLITEGDGFATSCKDLSEQEAERLIRQMELAAAAKGVWEIRAEARKDGSAEGKRKYDELVGRQGMATPKQLRMIEAMWADVSYYRNAEARERALRYFLNHITGVDDLRFVEAWQVRKVIKAIEKMKGRQYETKRCKALH
jgi:hypothetical protein